MEITRPFELFREALGNGDPAGTRTALSAMRTREKKSKSTSEDEKLIQSYKEFMDAEDDIRRGKGCRNFDILFNPYSGSVEEMFALCSCLEDKPGRALVLLMTGTENFLSELPQYSPVFREEAYPYLEKWLLELVDLIHSHIGILMSEEGKKGFSEPFALASLMSALIADFHFSSIVERSFLLFPKSIAEAEISFPSPSSPLNTAVRWGDMDTFGKFYDMESVRELIRPERSDGIRGKSGKIHCYPEKSTQMLDYLFSLGLLLPGTEEGERAFFYTIMHLNPSGEMTKRIKHPSYFKTPLSPLLAAVRNRDFSPDNYSLLIGSGCDISGSGLEDVELPPLAYAVESRNERKVETLISLGADISWHDRWGNNILHRLAAKGWKIEKDCYGKLYGERNIWGRTPSDYASRPSRKTLAGLERITFRDALDAVLSSPERRTYFFLEGGRFPSSGKIVGAVMEYLDGRPELSDVVSGKIETADALRHFLKASADGNGRYLLFVTADCFLHDPLIRELDERNNVTLFFTALSECGKFRVIGNLTERDNIFVSRTGSSLWGDILIGNGATAALEDDELIFRRDGEYHLVKDISLSRKRVRVVSRKSSPLLSS